MALVAQEAKCANKVIAIVTLERPVDVEQNSLVLSASNPPAAKTNDPTFPTRRNCRIFSAARRTRIAPRQRRTGGMEIYHSYPNNASDRPRDSPLVF